ncbi:MAG: toxin-antitoxin system YwqK family antitoxin [Bacteroidota bacterium]
MKALPHLPIHKYFKYLNYKLRILLLQISACAFTLLLQHNAIAQIQQFKKFYDGDSSRIKEIFHYSIADSSLELSYESFYLNGSLQTYGWYISNEPDSIWKYYYENGRPKAIGRYSKGTPNGKWKYYYENGNIKSEGILAGSDKEGYWTFYYENGGEKSNGSYFSNQKSGIWNYFYEDQSIKAQAYLENGKGRYTEFYPSGKRRMEGFNENEKSTGEWIYYFESGEIEAIGQFRNGLKTGKWTYYHKNGVAAAEGTYEKGMRVGNWIYYHDSGKVSQEGKLEEGQKDGYWKLFYPTGALMGEGDFIAGSGSYKEYYASGSIKSQGSLVSGKKSGRWRYFSENGALEGEAEFSDDLGKYTGYYPDRTIKMEGEIKANKRIGEWTLYNEDGSKAGTYHPIYEDEKPIFKTRISSDNTGRENFSTPEYRFKKRGFRYFKPRINEYRGVILASNPLWLIVNELPISVEYYLQERLGYELQVDLIRDPFFTSDTQIGQNQVFNRGVSAHFRQKFYHTDSRNGMFYFGHEILWNNINYRVKHAMMGSTGGNTTEGTLKESGIGYGLVIGNRWIQDAGNAGWTVDFYFGVSVSGRMYRKQYLGESEALVQIMDSYFEEEIGSRLHFPVQVGLNIGFVSPKSKSKTQ